MRVPSWPDVRPHEVRPVGLSFFGAFLVIAFLILARSLREAIYLSAFPVETLPYVVAAVALLSVPAVSLFARLLFRYEPRRALLGSAIVLAIGLATLWPVATLVRPAMVLFYLWTAIGTLLLTSGFWIVTAEHFPVRGAKRLYGLVGAGGTIGAIVMGNSIRWLLERAPLASLIPLLIGLLVAFVIVQSLLPRTGLSERPRPDEPSARGAGTREALALVWRTPHLRTIALIVAAATVASTLVDYQFKELAQGLLTTKEQLAGFFGSFYGWTGAIALLLQLLLAARLMTRAGVGPAVAVLPLVLLLGSAALFVAPGLLVATLVRGGDNSLRKSLHRSVLEVLWVPIPSTLRRRTKTFTDSVVDAGAEGIGAAIVFLWVTLPGFPARYLSLFVMAFAGFLLHQSWRMGRAYRRTVSERLVEAGSPDADEVARLDQSLLLSATFADVDIGSALERLGPEPTSGGARAADGAPPEAPSEAQKELDDQLRRLASSDPAVVASALDEIAGWTEAHLPALIRLLARDAFSRRAIAVLADLQESSTALLVAELGDETGDFVIRRRIPRVFARAGGAAADAALLDALTADRFEVRYRAASALVRRRQAGLPQSDRERAPLVWRAVRLELARERPVWELQRLLDEWGGEEDLLAGRAELRGQLSLKHTFRLLSLVLDPAPVRAAYQGLVSEDDRLLSLALEYLEQVLPRDVRERLWPFIGDLSERQRKKGSRTLGEVVEDLVRTGATVFQSASEREALRRLLGEPKKGNDEP